MPTLREINEPHLTYCQAFDAYCRCPKCSSSSFCGYQQSYCETWCRNNPRPFIKSDNVVYCNLLDGGVDTLDKADRDVYEEYEKKKSKTKIPQHIIDYAERIFKEDKEKNNET